MKITEKGIEILRMTAKAFAQGFIEYGMTQEIISAAKDIMAALFSSLSPDNLKVLIINRVIMTDAMSDDDIIALKNELGDAIPLIKKMLDSNFLLAIIRENYPNHFSIIMSTSGGVEWFKNQIEAIKRRLGL